jgi:hypothetical protein
MHEHAISLKYTQDHPDEVLATLEAVYRQARGLLMSQAVTLAEAKTLSEMVAHVRDLLTQWAEAESCMGKNAGLIRSIRDMKEQYLELEGRIKERRNDLS